MIWTVKIIFILRKEIVTLQIISVVKQTRLASQTPLVKKG